MAPSYYTLVELFYQRSNALAFGMDTAGLDFEIELMERYETGLVSARPFDYEVD